MTALRAGMKVVCVDAAPDRGRTFLVPLVKGAVYTLLRRTESLGYHDKPVWRLAEINSPIGFRASRFRPVAERKTSIEVFQKMLVPTKQKERA